ncbi:LacI family DNA-binding transcriptional regulator [Labilibaculum euxinus]|uniref:Substrate-binding domain-containing protein n=1 Tax=Labilibaculum euxinus TaxID=2686357 RepID=A0A7M4D3Q1_9BACT|nr:LacI family DNA-binding transcriptional regulator [Labilibaculum euxinus]MUP37280.1 substrate-binding domain-containing protein [Labilibaculum euxinus]MVB06485.1 substrate-binding domain-containing protein [Labilibaculum euxinus]
MANRPVTIKDIAEKLSISVSTVSRALKNNPEISLTTREAVQKLAKELKYQPNPLAVALKTQKSNTIGVVVPQIVSSFYATVVKGIEQIADEHNYQVFVSSSNERIEKEEKNVNGFLNMRMDGIILSLTRATTTYDHIHKIQDMGVPMVLFDRTSKELEVSKVVADDAAAAHTAVTHLINGGAKRVAFMTGPEFMLFGTNRLRGYKKALEDKNIPLDETLISRCDFTVEDAKSLALDLLSRVNRPDAIFAINDDMAIGAIAAAKELGLKIPNDLAVVGFSNSRRSRYMEPSVSTMDQNPKEVGREAARLLFEQMEKTPDAKAIKEVVVHADLIVRTSSDK